MTAAGLLARYRASSLGARILAFMALGIVAGLVWGEGTKVVEPLGELFIRLLMMSAIPLVFFNLLAGLSALDDARRFGRLAGKVLLYFFLTTGVAVALGLTAASLLRPGEGMRLSAPVGEAVGDVPSLARILIEMVPSNIVDAFSSGRITQVVVFAVLLGLAGLGLPEAPKSLLARGYAAAADLLRRLVELILQTAPFGIGALAATTVGMHGPSIFGALGRFLVGVWLAQAVLAGLYAALVAAFVGDSPWRFLRRTGPLYATAAATCSSLASLVVAFDVAERRLGIPRRVYGFTLPLGTQLNKGGTAIMLGGVLLFTAQAAGVSFDAAALVSVGLIGLLLTTGSPGIPGGGLVVALVYVQAFQLPVEVAAIVGGVYRLVDVGNTTLNVMGDLVGTYIVAHSEGDVEMVNA